GQIYTYNVLFGTPPRQLTSEGINIYPAFSPDGTRVAFSSRRTATDENDLFVKDLNDDSPPRPIMTFEANQLLTQWPSDSLIVFEVGPNTSGSNSSNRGAMDLWTVDLSDPDNPRAKEYLSSEHDLRRMVVSPDGTLAAYRSDESGQNEVYVASFPDPGEPTRISQDRGNLAFWSPDGDVLYIGPGSARSLVAARLQRNPMPVVSSFEESGFRTGQGATPFPGAALHPDGVRFIMAAATDWSEVSSDTPDQVVLVQNFFEDLKRLVPN
ncbi:MAG: TolB family protein, partial [Longimicrobiales bacterium]